MQPDGSVLVTERITYNFAGHFEGSYREITLEDGMSVDQVSVSEGGEQYKPGASAELGSESAPGTFGTANLGDRHRIVWHYRATGEQRTFVFEDIQDVFSGAFTPPSSGSFGSGSYDYGSSGSGGSFSGGGGGGGGAW